MRFATFAVVSVALIFLISLIPMARSNSHTMVFVSVCDSKAIPLPDVYVTLIDCRTHKHSFAVTNQFGKAEIKNSYLMQDPMIVVAKKEYSVGAFWDIRRDKDGAIRLDTILTSTKETEHFNRPETQWKHGG